ncbi:hypothetical protein MRX96_018229 [Rhipicephalus microplus]
MVGRIPVWMEPSYRTRLGGSLAVWPLSPFPGAGLELRMARQPVAAAGRASVFAYAVRTRDGSLCFGAIGDTLRCLR